MRVYPVDILTENFFRAPWKIDVPSDPSTFTYTERRAATEKPAHFADDAVITAEKTENGIKVEFSQATSDDERVNDYIIRFRNEKGSIAKQVSVWSHYYLYNMPEKVVAEIKDVDAGKYTVEVVARGFWRTVSDNSISTEIEL